MNKTEFVAKLSQNTGFSKKDTADFIDGFTQTVMEEVANGEDITFVGFGSFKVAERAARTTRNPRTGETINLPAKKAPRFKVGKVFKDKVAGTK